MKKQRRIEIALLPEVVALCERSIDACARLRKFFDDGGNIGTFKIDDAATLRAGHIIVNCQPAKGFRRCLAAIRADDKIENPAGSAHG